MNVNNYEKVVSVIVPIYNVEKYLETCIKSIVKQTYQFLEIILINDASLDGCNKICLEYEKKDSRIIVVNKEHNEGLVAARFTGLGIASGDYVMFVDGDDYIPHKAVETLLESAEKNNVDVVVGQSSASFRIRHLPFDISFPTTFLKNELNRKIDREELQSRFALSYCGVNLLPVNCWGKLFRRQLIMDAQPKPSLFDYGEDLVFNMNLFPYIHSMFIISERVYNYRRGSGMTSRFNPNFTANYRYLYHLKKNFVEHYNSKLRLVAENFLRVELLNFFITFVQQLKFYKDNDKDRNIELILKEIKNAEYMDLNGINLKSQKKRLILQSIKDCDAKRIYQLVETLEKKKFTDRMKLLVRKCFFT